MIYTELYIFSYFRWLLCLLNIVLCLQDQSAKELKLQQIRLDEERKQIVRAVGLRQGHWFKCPNGHIYVITECGGATQIGKCNECGAQIGGSNHTLLADNSLAPEMDGAQFPAYSDAANMANYRFENVN